MPDPVSADQLSTREKTFLVPRARPILINDPPAPGLHRLGRRRGMQQEEQQQRELQRQEAQLQALRAEEMRLQAERERAQMERIENERIAEGQAQYLREMEAQHRQQQASYAADVHAWSEQMAGRRRMEGSRPSEPPLSGANMYNAQRRQEEERGKK